MGAKLPIMLPDGLSGETGLLSAVIAIATRDAIGRDRRMAKDAWSYLGSELYRHHLSWLGLPGDAWPAPIDALSDVQLVDIVDRIFSNGQ